MLAQHHAGLNRGAGAPRAAMAREQRSRLAAFATSSWASPSTSVTIFSTPAFFKSANGS